MSDGPTQLEQGALAGHRVLAVVLSLPHVDVPSDTSAGTVSDRAVQLHVPGPGVARKASVCQ